MFEKFWEILKEKDNLLDQSKKEAIAMLRSCREMYSIVNHAIKEEVDSDLLETIHQADRKINKQQRSIRKMVFEHLSISSSKDLLTGLQLLNIVIDIERVGDYTKNIADLTEMIPNKFDWGEYTTKCNMLETTTMDMFDKTIKALEEDDTSCAEQVLKNYNNVSKECEIGLREIMLSKTSGNMVEKKYLALVLLFRYLKRVDAHLKNIATTLVNPFHKIGYRNY